MFDIWGLLFEFGYFLGADAYYYRNMKGPYKDHLVVQLEVQDKVEVEVCVEVQVEVDVELQYQ